MDGHMFDGLVEGLITFGIVIGLVIMVIVCIPLYYYGKSVGREEVKQHCIDNKLLEIRYNKENGQKEEHWATPSEPVEGTK